MNGRNEFTDMKFHATKLPGVFEIHLEPMRDERGFFARTWCRSEFEEHGLESALVQCKLTEENRNMVYVPKGCAHGFLTLQDETEVFYQMSEVYNAESARGVRWNDPTFAIAWPEKVEVISDRDHNYPDFK